MEKTKPTKTMKKVSTKTKKVVAVNTPEVNKMKAMLSLNLKLTRPIP